MKTIKVGLTKDEIDAFLAVHREVEWIGGPEEFIRANEDVANDYNHLVEKLYAARDKLVLDEITES